MPSEQNVTLLSKQEKSPLTESFYPEYKNNHYLETFDDIRFDLHSMNLFKRSMTNNGKYSFAYIGIMYQDQATKQPYIKIYINPTADDIDLVAKQGFDRADIVKAKPTNSAFFGGAGAVHRDILKIAQEKEKDCKDNVLGNCGGSLFTEVTDDQVNIAFVNRCNSNKLFNINNLALFTLFFTMEKKELVADSPNATIRIVERSIPKVEHDKFVTNFLDNISHDNCSGKKIIYNINRCHSYQVEGLWNEMKKLEGSERKKLLAQDLMMSMWLFSAGKRGSAMGSDCLNGYEDYLKTVISEAKENNITLNVDFIPEKYQDHGTALMVAAKKKYSNIIDILLTNKADIYRLDHNENNALFHGIQSGSLVAVNKLISHEKSLPGEKKPFIDHQNTLGKTSLMVAIEQPEQNPDMIKMLLEEKPDLTKQDKQGNSALFYAINSNNPKLVETLISLSPKDSDGPLVLQQTNADGKTPLKLAESLASSEIIQLITSQLPTQPSVILRNRGL